MPKRIIEPLVPQISAKPSGTPGKIPSLPPMVDGIPKERIQKEPVKAPVKAKKEKKHDPLIGQLLEGKYRVIREINSGGMGSIYLAKNEVLDKIVVVKTFFYQSLDPDASAREWKASDSGHPNIIYILDNGLTPSGNQFIVMQRLLGKDLSVVLKENKRLSWRRVLQITDDICSALSFLHNKKIYHCDIKPANLFLAEQGGAYTVKLLDFGIAKICNDDSIRNLNEHGNRFVGTAAYSSPEQAQNKADIDHRADVYSLGVTMYELLCGSIPFKSKLEHSDPAIRNSIRVEDIKRMHIQMPPPTFGEKGIEDVPLEVERDIVMRALEKDPRKRFQSMAEMRAQIASVLKKYATVSQAAEAKEKEKSAWDLIVLNAQAQERSFGEIPFDDSAPVSVPRSSHKRSFAPKFIITSLLMAAGFGALYYQNKDGCIDGAHKPVQTIPVRKDGSMKDGLKPKADGTHPVTKTRDRKPDASIRKKKITHSPASQPTKSETDAGEESESDSADTADPSDKTENPDNATPDNETQDKDTDTDSKDTDPDSKDNPESQESNEESAKESVAPKETQAPTETDNE